jgi:hypothetical protein
MSASIAGGPTPLTSHTVSPYRRLAPRRLAVPSPLPVSLFADQFRQMEQEATSISAHAVYFEGEADPRFLGIL